MTGKLYKLKPGYNPAAKPGGRPERPEGVTFTWWSAAELRPDPPPVEFLVDNVLTEGTHGPLGGAKKTLKSYTLEALTLAVASGAKFLGHFDVAKPGPVLKFVGEGGERPYRRRRNRIAAAMGLSADDVDGLAIHTTFDRWPIGSPEFSDALKEMLDEVQPVLVDIDALYNYHPTGVDVSNLYERGRMLSELTALVGGEATLLIADHFTKTGRGDLDLDSIAQAGMAQWADSWILQKHRETERPDLGQFRLVTQFGSREWGSNEFEVDWDIGRFDMLTRTHDGTISVTVNAVDWTGGRKGAADAVAREAIREGILKLVRADEWAKTKKQIITDVPGKDAHVAAELAGLESVGSVRVERRKRLEGSRNVERDVYGTEPLEFRGLK